MAFVSMLDDSNLDKIRKSIFLFSSVIFFSAIYKLEITAPKSLFSSATGASEPIVITYQVILLVLALFQIYLSSRLYLAWKISKAKFKKFWIMDEFEGKEDKLDLLKELNDFKDFCQENSFPEYFKGDDHKKLYREVASSIEAAVAELKNVNGVIKESGEVFHNTRDMIVSTNKLMVDLVSNEKIILPEQQDSILKQFPHLERIRVDAREPKFTGNLHALLDNFIREAANIENNEIRPNIQRLERSMSLVRPRLDAVSKAVDSLGVLEKKHNEFLSVFPESNYKMVIETKLSELTKSKKMREIELNLFEFWIPLGVAFVSLLFCISPYFSSIEYLVSGLGEFLKIVQ